MMNDDLLARGLATLAEDMPAPDVGDIVAKARSRIRRRRAVGASWIATVAVVGVLTGAIAALAHHPLVSSAHPLDSGASRIDDRARTLEQQLNQAQAHLLPAGLAVAPDPLNPVRVDGKQLGLEFSTTARESTPALFVADPTGGVPIDQDPYDGVAYLLDVRVANSQSWGTLTIRIQRSTRPAPEVMPSCETITGQCQSSQLPDGTIAIVAEGTTTQMQALRPNRTFVDVVCTNQSGSVQPPLTGTDLLKFATIFTY